MMYDVISHVDSSLPPMNVSFLSSTALDTDAGNIIGNVIETGMCDTLTMGHVLVHVWRHSIDVASSNIGSGIYFCSYCCLFVVLCYNHSRSILYLFHRAWHCKIAIIQY